MHSSITKNLRRSKTQLLRTERKRILQAHAHAAKPSQIPRVKASLATRRQRQPWLGLHGEDLNWSWFRKAVARIVCGHFFETTMGLIILFNASLIILETNTTAQCYPDYAENIDSCPYDFAKNRWFTATNFGLLCLYTVELAANMFIYRRQFFRAFWNQLDFLVVVAGLFGLFFDSINLAFLRILRIARVIRALRIFRNVRELYLLLTGIASSMKAIFFGTFLLFAIFICCAILMVDFVHPTTSRLPFGNCTDCNKGFETVQSSVLTLFSELIAGGSWLMSLSVYNANPGATALIILTTISIVLGIMNLILTVIVERATDAREKDIHEVARHKLLNHVQAKDELLELCTRIHKDDAGRVTLPQILALFRTSDKFHDLMVSMDVCEDELRAVFETTDTHGTGHLCAEEFCEELFHLRSADTRMLVSMVRLNVVELQHTIHKQLNSSIAKLLTQVEEQSCQIASIDAKVKEMSTSAAARNAPGMGANMFCPEINFEDKDQGIKPILSNSDMWIPSCDTRCNAQLPADDALKHLEHILDHAESLLKEAIIFMDTSWPEHAHSNHEIDAGASNSAPRGLQHILLQAQPEQDLAPNIHLAAPKLRKQVENCVLHASHLRDLCTAPQSGSVLTL